MKILKGCECLDPYYPQTTGTIAYLPYYPTPTQGDKMNNTGTQTPAIGSVKPSQTDKSLWMVVALEQIPDTATLAKMGSNKGTLWRISDVSEFFEVVA